MTKSASRLIYYKIDIDGPYVTEVYIHSRYAFVNTTHNAPFSVYSSPYPPLLLLFLSFPSPTSSFPPCASLRVSVPRSGANIFATMAAEQAFQEVTNQS